MTVQRANATRVSLGWAGGLIGVGVLVLALWLFWGHGRLQDLLQLPPATRTGFDGIEALFTGLAFAAVLVTLRLQSRQLSFQLEELRLQREELHATLEELSLQRKAIEAQAVEAHEQALALRIQAKEIRNQVEGQQRQLDIAALTAFLQERASKRIEALSGAKSAAALITARLLNRGRGRELTAVERLKGLVDAALERIPPQSPERVALEEELLRTIRTFEEAAGVRFEPKLTDAAGGACQVVVGVGGSGSPPTEAKRAAKELEKKVEGRLEAYWASSGRVPSALTLERDEESGELLRVSIDDGWL